MYAILDRFPAFLHPPIYPNLSTALNWNITGIFIEFVSPSPKYVTDNTVVPGTCNTVLETGPRYK